MKRKRFDKEDILNVLRSYEAGESITSLSKKYGFAKSTFYSWRTKYDNTDSSNSERLRIVQAENRKLKKLLAETMLEKTDLSEALNRK